MTPFFIKYTIQLLVLMFRGSVQGAYFINIIREALIYIIVPFFVVLIVACLLRVLRPTSHQCIRLLSFSNTH